MLTTVENEALKSSNLKAAPKFCYVTLNNFCYNIKDICYPGKARIAQELHCSVRTVDRYINLLITEGLIIKNRRGKNKTNVYELPYKRAGHSYNRLRKNCKMDTTKNKQKENKDKNIDDIDKSAIINYFIEKYDATIVAKALDRIKNYTIVHLRGFKLYLEKTIQTIIKASQHSKKVAKKYYKRSKAKKNTFCDYKQREYDYEDLERKLLGWDKEEDTDSSVDTNSSEDVLEGLRTTTPPELNWDFDL